jgi:putative ABC transport system permease protein
MSSILVVAQLIIFSSFVFCGLVIYAQYHFAINADPGFNRQNILYVSVDEEIGSVDPFIADIALNSNIVGVGKSNSTLPATDFAYLNVPNSQNPEVMVSLAGLDCDPDFIETLGLNIVEGRNFSKEHIADKNNVCIMSKMAVQSLGIENPLTTKWGELSIVGIVDDFYMHSLHSEIEPVIIFYSMDYVENIAVRYKPDSFHPTLEILESTWRKHFPEQPFEYVTTDALFKEQYEKEYKTTIIITLSALFSMIIAMLGIFGLTLYFLQQSTKDIGMRKILGSTSLQIAAKYVRRYALLVVVANAISMPVSYMIMQQWLVSYAQHIPIYWWIYALTFGFTLTIVSLTVFWQSFKASKMNPVEALRYE